MCGNACQFIHHVLDLDLADALDEGLKGFALLTFRYIPTCESLHHFRNSFGWHSANSKTIRTSVMRPFATQHHLKMRHRIVPRMTTHSIEAKIGNVMLSA